MKEIRSFLEGVVRMGHARWVDLRHIEIIQSDSDSHCSHLVTQEPETLMQSRSERVVMLSHPEVTGGHPVATPMQGEPIRPEMASSAGEAVEQTPSDLNEVDVSRPASESESPQPIAGGDPTDSKAVEPEPSPISCPPADDTTSSPQSHQRCGATVHNTGANGRRVRFLDREPVPPSLRGREAQVERDTHPIAIVWVKGIRRHVLKEWLVEESDTSAKTALGGSQMTSTPTLGEQKPEPSPTSPPPVDDNAHITKQDWNTLVAACKEAGMRWIPSLKFIAEAIGVPVEKLDHLQITQRQYQQAMRLVEEYRRSIEKERRISEAREKIEDKWFER